MPKYAMSCSFGIYVFFLGYVHVYGQLCLPDSVGHTVYGPGCKYICHCKDNKEQCDNTTGRCVSGCANEWMGPGCQYRNILWRKEAWQSGTNDAYNTVDGRTDTCTRSLRIVGPIWWRAWFEQAEMIRGLTIVTEIGQFSKFKVYVENNTERTNDTGFQQQEICYEHDGKSSKLTTISITCVRPVRGNQVRIQLASEGTRLVLCDVSIFGGRNLAYSKYTHQSSTFYGSYTSSKAVDGAIDGICAATEVYRNTPHTWTVDLGDIFRVQALQLISNQNFISTDIIQVGVDKYLYPVQFTPSTDNTSFFTLDVNVRYLQFKRSTGYILLCEVFIYGDCLDYKCGLDCSIPCHCAMFTFENKVSGECLEGCAAGWTGQGRRCDTACPAGTFGINCSKHCSSNCVENGDCDKENGHCFRGCAAGWKGNTCNAECVVGFYGPNCSHVCSEHCFNTRVCYPFDGRCKSGCEPGWKGEKCDEQCIDRTYGHECKEQCSDHCVGNDVCSKVDGHCPRGCSPGWKGDKCQTGCKSGTYGLNCSKQCSGHCVDNGICDKVHGHCPRGCTDGWMGDKCDAVCSHGWHGVNCRDRCSSHCHNETLCDKTNGRCEGGCKAGWQGLTCLTECNNDTYGAECSGQCSGHCMYNDVCDKVDGRCARGCASGWMGDKCDTECPGGTYGINCRHNCSGHCLNEAFCNRDTGVCDERCKPGWTGSSCNDECLNGTFGMDCFHNCSGHCVDKEPCNKTDGHCDGGCETGWQGSLCEIVVLSVHDEQNNGSVVLATIVAVLALLSVVIVTVVAYKRFYLPSRRNKRHQEPVPVQSSDETAYVNRMIASGLDSVDRLPLRNTACDNADQSQQPAATVAQDGCEYYNLVERTPPIVKMPEHGILLEDLIRCLEDEKHHLGKLAAEFAEIPTIAEHSCLEAQKSSNKHKNRYQKMYPYDHNRVILHTVGSDPSSDYLNASHIDGYKLRDAFIAAQGTTKANIGDFWRLIWEKKIKVIVMLTELYEQGKMKCERYWDSTGPITFGDITVTVLSEEQFAEFTIRTFLAKYVGNKSPLLVQQYHYTAWPDKSCPDGTASLLCFWGRVNKNNPKSDTPWLVHCSAGVGRTGTFIALDILISQGRDTGYVDVYGCVEALRQQRVFMVQTKGQYIYLHVLLADALVLHSLPASTDEFLRLTSSGALALDHAWNAVKVHMKVGDNGPGSDSRSKSGVMKENRHKNRFEYIVPDDQYRPYLSMTSDGSSNYINAVYMPSYRRKHGLILTQTPLPTTTADWWRLVHQNRIQTVLAFGDTPTSETTGSCFPMDRKLENGQFQTRQMSFEQDRGFTISKHNLSYEGESRELTYLQYQEWPNDQLVPSDSVAMLHFCQEVLALQNQHLDSPLLIQCFDGATRSGLMAVLLNALDRLRVEEEVAVLQILHHLRLRRPQIVPNKEQLQFCYDVIRRHLQEGSTYANL